MKRKKYSQYFNVINIILVGFLIIVFFTKFTLLIDNSYKRSIYLGEYLLLKNSLITNIFQQYPEIIKIKTKIYPLEKKIELKTIKEKPVAKICYQNNCYFLGEHNYIYQPSTKNTSDVSLLTINSRLPIINKSILDKNISDTLEKIFEYSNTNNYFLTKIEILSNKDLKIYTTDFNFLIDPFKDINNQIKKLTYFLNNYKGKYKEIDLRINDRIYFK
ncbi:MAG: hypothetical protein KatS3mg094_307 [Candidatus Parcubacteria bacterium]|nr:MAG: hypothetical protein KatS3mg094_307 [Candidatus Parcubacteria bacterium]